MHDIIYIFERKLLVGIINSKKMDKKVIHLFGASGSGTTTLGRFMADHLNAFFMDTDDYYWESVDPPYTVKRAIPDRLKLIKSDLAEHECSVLSGSLVNWGDELIPQFTLAIRVVTDSAVRLDRLRAREYAHFGSRIEPGGDMYEQHQKFIEWASSYDTGGVEIRSKAMHDEWQKLLKCPLVTVDGSLPLETNWEFIKQYL